MKTWSLKVNSDVNDLFVFPHSVVGQLSPAVVVLTLRDKCLTAASSFCWLGESTQLQLSPQGDTNYLTLLTCNR